VPQSDREKAHFANSIKVRKNQLSAWHRALSKQDTGGEVKNCAQFEREIVGDQA
jgi:hypothetical protein